MSGKDESSDTDDFIRSVRQGMSAFPGTGGLGMGTVGGDGDDDDGSGNQGGDSIDEADAYGSELDDIDFDVGDDDDDDDDGDDEEEAGAGGEGEDKKEKPGMTSLPPGGGGAGGKYGDAAGAAASPVTCSAPSLLSYTTEVTSAAGGSAFGGSSPMRTGSSLTYSTSRGSTDEASSPTVASTSSPAPRTTQPATTGVIPRTPLSDSFGQASSAGSQERKSPFGLDSEDFTSVSRVTFRESSLSPRERVDLLKQGMLRTPLSDKSAHGRSDGSVPPLSENVTVRNNRRTVALVATTQHAAAPTGGPDAPGPSAPPQVAGQDGLLLDIPSPGGGGSRPSSPRQAVSAKPDTAVASTSYSMILLDSGIQGKGAVSPRSSVQVHTTLSTGPEQGGYSFAKIEEVDRLAPQTERSITPGSPGYDTYGQVGVYRDASQPSSFLPSDLSYRVAASELQPAATSTPEDGQQQRERLLPCHGASEAVAMAATDLSDSAGGGLRMASSSWRGLNMANVDRASLTGAAIGSPREGDSSAASQLHSMAQLEGHITDFAAKKEVGMRELHLVQGQLAQHRTELRRAEADLSGKTRTVGELRMELMVLERQRNGLHDEIDLLSSRASNMQSVDSGERDPKTAALLNTLQQEVLAVKAERTELRLHVDRLEERNQQDDALHKRALADARTSLERVAAEADIERRQQKDAIQALRQDLEEARHKIREVRREKDDAVARTRDEAKALKQQEVEAMKHKLIQDRAVDVERVKEREARHGQDVQRQLAHKEKEVEALAQQLRSREEATVALSSQVRQLKKAADATAHRQLDMVESEKHSLENTMRREKAAAIGKLQETMKNEKQRELHELQEKLQQEKQTALTRAEKKLSSQLDDLQKSLRLKDEELKSTRELLREQEDATRALGENLRLQARTQVKNVVDKEREKCEREFERERKRLRELHHEEAQRLTGKSREEQEKLKQKITALQSSLTAVRQDVEEQRTQVKQLQRDRTTAINHAKELSKQESKQDLAKMRQSLEQDASSQRDQLRHRNSQLETEVRGLRVKEAAAASQGKEIQRRLDELEHAVVADLADECRRSTIASGGSPGLRRRPGEKSSDLATGKAEKVSSTAKQALLSMRQAGSELRQHLADTKAELEREKQGMQRTKKERLQEVAQQRELSSKQVAEEVERQRIRLSREHAAEKSELEKSFGRRLEQRVARTLECKDAEMRERLQTMHRTQEEEQRSSRARMSDDVSMEAERRLAEQLKKVKLQHQKEIQGYVREIEQLNRQIRRSPMSRSSSSGTLATDLTPRLPRSSSFNSGLNTSFTSPEVGHRRHQHARTSSLRRSATAAGLGESPQPPTAGATASTSTDALRPSRTPPQPRKTSSGRRELPKIPTDATPTEAGAPHPGTSTPHPGTSTPHPGTFTPHPGDSTPAAEQVGAGLKLKEAHMLIKRLQKRNKQLKADYRKVHSAATTAGLVGIDDIVADSDGSFLMSPAGVGESEMAMTEKLVKSVKLLEQKRNEVSELREQVKNYAEVQLQLERQLDSIQAGSSE